LGERASNLFGVLLSLTFFSVLLAVMLVAVSILPDGPSLAPPTLPGETRSGPVRTPQPVTLGDLALAPAPALAPPGAGLATVTFTTGVIPPPAGPSVLGGGTGAGPGGGPTRGGFGPGRAPTGPSRIGDGQAGGDRALEKAKSRAERAKDRSERAAEKAKKRAEKVRERGKEQSGNRRGDEAVQATKPKPSRGKGEGPPGGKGRGKGKKH
jgi:hypothetical protein